MELMDSAFWTAIGVLAFALAGALLISALVCMLAPSDRD
jgi:hypothetical protein